MYRAPDFVSDELGEFRAGIPDYVVWGEPPELTSFITENGISDFKQPQSQFILVEVKYTERRRPTFTDSQPETFSELQNRGIDLFIFVGSPKRNKLKRY